MRRWLLVALVVSTVALPAAGQLPKSQQGAPPASTAVVSLEQLELAADRLQWERWFPPPDKQTSPTIDQRVLMAALTAEGSTAGAISLRAYAVRALGRLQNPKDLATIVSMLGDASPEVQRSAAAAIAQCLWNATDQPDAVKLARLSLERSLPLGTAMYDAYGSLPYRDDDDFAHILQVIGLNVAGLEPLTRRHPGLTLTQATITVLRQRVVPPSGGKSQMGDITALRVLQNIHDDDVATIKAAAMWRCGGSDECGFEGRLIGLQMMSALDERYADAFDHALHDGAWQVRHAALTKVSQIIAKTGTCAPLIETFDDRVDLVVRHAIELLSPECVERKDLTERLIAWAEKLGDGLNDARWHIPATALETLVKFAPDAAHKIAKDVAAKHHVWQVRVVAARIAGVLFDEDLAMSLVRHDADAPRDVIEANVRSAALKALRKMNSTHLADASIDALTDPDDELVYTAASMLKASGRHDAVTPILDALTRLSKRTAPERRAGRQTAATTLLQAATLDSARDSSRDARLSLLDALQPLAAPEDNIPLALRDLLSDTDPIVASAAADTIAHVTATRPVPKPTKLAPIQPSEREIINQPRCGRMEFDNGTQIDLLMDMTNAPIAAARFLTLATDKFYDGLTFHRVEVNSFVQAGSPDANELSTGERFIRDEIAGPVTANSLALVSRGPDTAAGQFFIAQVDVPALNHEFTVFASVHNTSLNNLLRDGKIVEGTKITSVREVNPCSWR